MPGIQRLLLSACIVDLGMQSRQHLDDSVVEEYAAAMAEEATFPPIVVFADESGCWVADGFHRIAAAQQAGLVAIAADVRQGSRRDALLFAVGANASHGLRRTNADKRRAVEILLGDEEWREWSDREIARRAGVGNVLVSSMRMERSVHGEQIDARVVRRGRSTYSMKRCHKARSAAEAADQTDQGTTCRQAVEGSPEDDAPCHLPAASNEDADGPSQAVSPVTDDTLRGLLASVGHCQRDEARKILHSLAGQSALACWIEADDSVESLQGLKVHLRQQFCRLVDGDCAAARDWLRSHIEELNEILEGRTGQAKVAS